MARAVLFDKQPFEPDRSMTHGRERTFDGIRGP